MSYNIKLASESFKLELLNGKYNIDLHDLEENPTLISCKNSFLAFQTLIECDEAHIINVGKTDYLSQKGDFKKFRFSISAPHEFTMNIEDMHIDDDFGYRADALLSFDSFECKENSIHAIYCEAKIPKTAKKGTYNGVLKIFESNKLTNEKLILEIPFEYNISAYKMKDTKDYKFHLDLWQHLCNIARKAETPIWSNEHFEVIERYVKVEAELGVKAVTLMVTDIPWNGQNCEAQKTTLGNYFEYSIVPITKKINGKFSYDFSKMQRYIDICKKYGIDKEIQVFGFINNWADPKPCEDYPDNVRIRYYDEKTESYNYMRKAKDVDAYIVSIYKYFQSKNLCDILRFAADEPADMDAYRASTSHFLQLLPEAKLKAALNHLEFVSEFGDVTDDFVPSIQCLCAELPKLKEYQKSMGDKRFLWYVCCSPLYPNNFLFSDLCESYFIGILTSYLNLDGFLRWNFTAWPDEPRKDLRFGSWKTGDTCFVYPQNNGYPLLTIRYKAFKRAIEFFEMLEDLKLKDKDAADKAFEYAVVCKDISKYFENPYDGKPQLSREEICSLSYNKYCEMREFLYNSLLKK